MMNYSKSFVGFPQIIRSTLFQSVLNTGTSKGNNVITKLSSIHNISRHRNSNDKSLVSHRYNLPTHSAIEAQSRYLNIGALSNSNTCVATFMAPASSYIQRNAKYISNSTISNNKGESSNEQPKKKANNCGIGKLSLFGIASVSAFAYVSSKNTQDKQTKQNEKEVQKTKVRDDMNPEVFPTMRDYASCFIKVIKVVVSQNTEQTYIWGAEMFDSLFGSADCCGIVGVIGSDNALQFISEGIQVLQNRGYDSAGISTMHKGSLYLTKYASIDKSVDDPAGLDCIQKVVAEAASKHVGHSVGIGHTRWATHGGKTDKNAHPHYCHNKKVALVHNGTISNYTVLRNRLVEKGINPVSETDTEIIALTIGLYCNNDGSNFEAAFREVVEELRGTWGLLAMHVDRPDVLMVARHGSPLIISIKDERVYVASEASALANYADTFVEVAENEIISLSCKGVKTTLSGRAIHPIEVDDVFLTPHPYEYWTDREIHEQPQSITSALGLGGRIRNNRVVLGGLEQKRDVLAKVKHVIITACGTSMHSAMIAASLLRSQRVFESVEVVDASEFVVNQYINTKQGSEWCVIFLSQSGETLDCTTLVKNIRTVNEDVSMFSIVNVVGSSLARLTSLGVYINAGREVAVASTKAFICQSVIAVLICGYFAQINKINNCEAIVANYCDSLSSLSQKTESVLSLSDMIKEFCPIISDARSMFVLGKGLGHAVALEGALKIKEVAYIHAEGYSAGALKHGPFALLSAEERTPVILIILDDEHHDFMINTAEQVKSRGARSIIITDSSNPCIRNLSDEVWMIPSCGDITALLAVIPIQLLAFHLAVGKGINPDKPRGLAKTVTVW